jgi:hypothetical protein
LGVTVWAFEGGPWDGHRIRQRLDMLVPKVQEVIPLDGPPVVYELSARRDPDTWVYTVREQPKEDEAP